MKVLIILIIAISYSVQYNNLELPYQSHSINDLNLALQELIKGTYNFKFDVSQVTQESCEQYSTWNRTYSDCGYYGDFGFKICCLGMRGDWSQQPIFYNHFNTTEDMLAMISNPKYSFIFNKNTPIKKYLKTKYFAINFQYKSRTFSKTTDFIYKFLKLIEDRKLNLKLVTGTTSLVLYYDNKCIVEKQCNEKEEYISNSDIILQELYNGPRNRTISFNVRASLLPSFCGKGFPEYMYKNSQLPIQFWQPSYQDSIYEVYDRFWEEKCNKTDVDVNRFKITSNMNSENLSVLLQKSNQTSKIQYVPPKFRFQDTRAAVIEYNNQFKVFFISKQNTLNLNYELNAFTDLSFQKSLFNVVIFKESITKLSTKGEYLLVELTSQLIVYQISTTQIQQISTLNKRSDYICSDIVLVENEPYFALSSLQNQYTMEVKLINILGDGKTLLKVNQSILNVDVSGIQYVSSICHDNQIVQVYTYGYTNQKNGIKEIKFFYNTIQLSNTVSELIQPSFPQHFGTNTSLKIEEYNGHLYFISTSGDGSAWSGVLINNNNWNKCTMYKDDFFKMVRNIPYTITYMWGRLDDLIDRIKGSNFINSCDEKIMTTKVFNGKNPQLTIVRDEMNRPTAYLIVDFVHYHKFPALTTTYYMANSYENNYPDDDNFYMTELVSFDLLEYDVFDLY